MKVALISDTHIGITDEGRVADMLKELSEETFDVLVHAGDYSGSYDGFRMVQTTLELMRKQFPDKPIVSVIGNHDFWCRPGENKHASLESFVENYDNVKQAFKDHSVHFLDEDGIYQHPDFPTIFLLGHSGWYLNPNPPTNDRNFLPFGLGGHTDIYLQKKAMDHVNAMLALYPKAPENTLVFISHFPVINKGRDWKGAFEHFSWSERLGKELQLTYGCKHFLNGHAHQRHNGPLRYESGSDYYHPQFLVITI